MKRRALLAVAVTGVMIAVVVFAQPRKDGKLLLLEWASKATGPKPPTAVLIELGLKDTAPTAWNGRAAVSGAKVVYREGYRFREGDKLIDPDAWEATSHRPMRLPARNPAVARLEGIATVGVVLHLSEVQSDAKLTLPPRPGTTAKEEAISLKDVLGGKQKSLWDGEAVVRLITTATPVAVGKTEDDFPAAAYGPDGTLWVAYISYTLKDESRRVEGQQLAKQPANFKDYYSPEFGDQLFVRSYRDGKWSEPIAVTEPNEDLVRCGLAVDGSGDAWVGYAANRQGAFGVYVRPVSKKYSPEGVANPSPRPGPEEKLTRGSSPSLGPVMTTDARGVVRMVWQSWEKDGKARFARASCANGRATRILDQVETPVGGPTNLWSLSLSAGPRGDLATVHDGYADGDYDVVIRTGQNGGFEQALESPRSSRFEARPSACCDPAGRLWVAYEDGPELWGKDYGAQDAEDGKPLYNARSVRVVCLHNDRCMRPTAELPTSEFKPPTLPFEPAVSNRFEKATRYAHPQLGLDGKGRLWLTYREKFGSRYSTHPGSYWLTFARRLEGDHWSEPIEVHHSDGLLDSRPVMLPHASGGLVIVHNTDGRYTTPDLLDNQIYMSFVDLPGEPGEPKLVPHDSGKKDDKLVQRAKEEAETVKRIRDHRIEAAGKKYRLLRGEFHRHTEVSSDGGSDGSLEDMFRYGIDAAGFDWIGNGDHDNGNGREYTWWLTQKLTDAYHVPGAFTPMFTYERSVAYPHGHRNCMFDKRGVRTLPRLAEPDMAKRVATVHADDTKMLYRYLHEMDGICAVHTSATSMGTDWRDHDPKVEPIVEIYQGDRMSYEVEGAPRAGYEASSGKAPVNVAGWFPLGFLNHAFAKGYKMSFQASSDHWSTHISYCIVLAETHDRKGILDAIKKRHCYGATDDIIVDLRSGSAIMGDELKTGTAPALEFHVVGTKPLARIDIIKDSKVVDTIKTNGREHRGKWTDPKPERGEHYYYIRVLQTDDEIAWASPLWIDYAP